MKPVPVSSRHIRGVLHLYTDYTDRQDRQTDRQGVYSRSSALILLCGASGDRL